MKRAATFDPTGQYRYSLTRWWDGAAPAIAFLMLNPSTADHQQDDPTIRRCIGLAQAWGYGSLEIVNLFAYRTTVPTGLKTVSEPVGAENDQYLLQAAQMAEQVILAWGNWGTLMNRDRTVLDLLQQQSIRSLYCLALNKSGQPRHPLYIQKTCQPMPYDVVTSPVGANGHSPLRN
ncbi:MAG: DUF1643 domain-containing protein [Thainema sp.]